MRTDLVFVLSGIVSTVILSITKYQKQQIHLFVISIQTIVYDTVCPNHTLVKSQCWIDCLKITKGYKEYAI